VGHGEREGQAPRMTDQQEFPPEVVEALAQRLFAIDWSSEWAAANHQQKSAYRDKASEVLAAVMPSLPALGYRRVGEGECVVPREPLPEMVAAWWRVKNGHHFHDEPPPTDRSDYAAYRALLAAAPAPEDRA
jgi:hypothetical protein